MEVKALQQMLSQFRQMLEFIDQSGDGRGKVRHAFPCVQNNVWASQDDRSK